MNALDEVLKETRKTIAQIKGWENVSDTTDVYEVLSDDGVHLGYVLHTKTCMECGKRGEIIVTDAEAEALLKGQHPYKAMPDRDPDIWEQIHTGYHPECWNIAFPEEE
jgi:hypothetical protein